MEDFIDFVNTVKIPEQCCESLFFCLCVVVVFFCSRHKHQIRINWDEWWRNMSAPLAAHGRCAPRCYWHLLSLLYVLLGLVSWFWSHREPRPYWWFPSCVTWPTTPDVLSIGGKRKPRMPSGGQAPASMTLQIWNIYSSHSCFGGSVWTDMPPPPPYQLSIKQSSLQGGVMNWPLSFTLINPIKDKSINLICTYNHIT